MNEHPKMKEAEILREPRQRCEFHVGIVSAQREPDTIFSGRVALLLRLDFEQALELQRCLVAAMQQKFVGDELLAVELESGVLEVYSRSAASKQLREDPG